MQQSKPNCHWCGGRGTVYGGITCYACQNELKAYRVIMDEPIGICLGFKPVGVEVDEFELIIDSEANGDEGIEEYVFISLNGGMLVVTIDEDLPHRKEWAGKLPKDHEPDDLFIWRSEPEFREFMTDLAEEWEAKAGWDPNP